MPEKKCFKCDVVKPLSEFYKHPRMADGHLNKCKQCTKADTARTSAFNSTDPHWVVSERKRQREKSRRYRDEGRVSVDTRSRSEKDPVKRYARNLVAKAIKAGEISPEPCVVCQDDKSQSHHEDYARPLDVHWVCARHHSDRHIYLRDCAVLGLAPVTFEEQFQITPKSS